MTDRFFETGSRRDSAEGKPSLSRLPWTALGHVAFVHEFGDSKYGMGNWRKGQPMSVLFDSMLRHARAIMVGKDYDSGPRGSGLLHAAHMVWNGLVVLHQMIYSDRYAHLDDRLDDFGNWVNPKFAETALAKELEKGGFQIKDII